LFNLIKITFGLQILFYFGGRYFSLIFVVIMFFLFSTASRPTLGATQVPIQGIAGHKVAGG
jgi:hypothetical protein